MTSNGLGARIREARQAAGLKQTELAVKLDVTQATIANYERGNTQPPSMRRFRSLADALGVDLIWLLEGDKEEVA
jgi:transcriptional regulator with XRE-family HTH domain